MSTTTHTAHPATRAGLITFFLFGFTALHVGGTDLGYTLGAIAGLGLLVGSGEDRRGNAVARGARTTAAALVLAMTPARGGRRNARVRTTATA